MNENFLLIHGAFHGAWCWRGVIDHLEQSGARALAIDLPGNGDSHQFGWTVGLQTCVKAIHAAANELGDKVHVVGHSMGGAMITAAAEADPALFSSLTYVTAFIPDDNKSVAQMAAKFQQTIAQDHSKAHLLRGSATMAPEGARTLLYSSCNPADRDRAIAQMGDQPLRPISAPIRKTDARWGKIPRNYVFCELDQALTIDQQRDMERAFPCGNTVTLAADHSPFVGMPEDLAEALLSFAAAPADARGQVV